MRIRLPATITLPGRLMEVRLSFGVVHLICEIPDAPRPQHTVIGVDLGVNSLVAATDGAKAVLISGRGVKAIIQWRNKTLAAIQQKQAAKTKGSRRWKRLHRYKYRMLAKTKRQCATRPIRRPAPLPRHFPARRVMWASHSTRPRSVPDTYRLNR